ncbi:MAG: hypothetical protein JWQ98_2377 [Chlorobi bacterium]|nr:hypothetical protein [Chlorobiota bacterium]
MAVRVVSKSGYRRVSLRPLLMSMFAVLASAVASAQPAPAVDSGSAVSPTPVPAPAGSPFRFSGSARLYAQTANRQGTYQETPADFVRMELSPTLSFYNVPFTVNLVLSTEQSVYRQNMNSISFDLDYHKLEGEILQRAYDKVSEIEELKRLQDAAGGVERLRDSLGGIGEEKLRELDQLKEYADIEKIKDKALSESMSELDKLGLVSASEKFFANFPALSVGVTYPNYTPLTLNDVPVTGANVEWNPGMFYVAAAAGKTQRAILLPRSFQPGAIDTVLNNPSYTRTLFAARLGYGKKDGGHFIVTGVYAKDDKSSLPLDSNGLPVTPKSNYVLGMDVNVPLFEDHFLLQAEGSGSLLTGDQEAARFKSSEIPDFVQNSVDPNISSVVDYAYALRSIIRLPETDTRLTASLKKVGPAYFSLGVPSLRNDNLRWDANLEQKFLRRQITATVFVKRDLDNVFPTFKTAQTSIFSYGVGLGLNFSKYPYLRLQYSPYEQRYSDVSDTLNPVDINNTTSLLSATAGYNYKVFGINGGTTVNYSQQTSNSYQGISDYGVTTIGANQFVNFAFPLSLSVGVTSSSLRAAGDSANTLLSVDLGASYTAFDVWNNTAGFNISKQGGTDDNVGFFITSSIGLWDFGVFEVSAQRNVYRSFVVSTSNYNEFLLSATLSTRW